MFEDRCKRGESVVLEFKALDEFGNSVPLSNFSLFFYLKRNIEDKEYYLSITNDMEEYWDKSRRGDGIIVLRIPSSMTKDLEVRNYFGEFVLVFDSGEVVKSETIKLWVDQAISD